jgi:HAE1 family hydrophobic/amphiphilic exporter-1
MRFRPIIMTSFAFILGVLPLVFATGAGAASRQSLGTAVCGGMITATVLAVFFVPVFYVAIQSLIEFLSGPPVPPPGFHAPGEEAEHEMTLDTPSDNGELTNVKDAKDVKAATDGKEKPMPAKEPPTPEKK